MAVNNIKKINVRSPYYIEVVGKDPEVPEVPDITEPIVPVYDMDCGIEYSLGSASGIYKYRINMAGREFGSFVMNIIDIKVPMRMRIYNEGATAGAWTTRGRDSYAAAWLEATGEDDSELTSRQGAFNTYPTITQNLTYTYSQSESDTYGDYLILELLMPLQVANPSVSSVCQPQASIAAPTVTGYVHVLTIEHRANAPASGYTISVNGTVYNMPANNRDAGGGIRLIYDNTTPLIAPQSNDNPYPRTGNLYSYSFLEWDYTQMDLIHLPYSSFNVNSQDINVTHQSESRLSLSFRLARRPVADIGGVRTLLPADKGYTASIHFEHQTPNDVSHAKFNFGSDLKPYGVFDTFINGNFTVDSITYLINQI